MILHHYNVRELAELVKDYRRRIELIEREVEGLEEDARHTPYFFVGKVEVDSFAYLEFLDNEKEKFQKDLVRLEERLFELRKELKQIDVRYGIR